MNLMRGASPFLKSLSKTANDLMDLQAQVADLQMKVQGCVDALHAYPVGQLNPLKAAGDSLVKRLAGFATTVVNYCSFYGTFQASLPKMIEACGSALAALLRAEVLKGKIEAAQEFKILSVKTSVLGGSVVSRTGPLKGGHLMYTGGAIVTYMICDPDGSAKAGLLIEETPMQEARF